MKHRVLALIAAGSALLFAQVAGRSGAHPEDIDKTCKPCDDFWRYATGGWHDRNPIPSDESSWGLGTALADTNRAELRDILEAAAADRSEAPSSNRKKMGDLYASCMDTAAIDERGTSPLQPDFDRIAAIRSREGLVAFITALQRITSPSDGSNLAVVAGPFLLGVSRDRKDPTKVIATLGEQAGAGGAGTSLFSLPGRDYFLKGDAKSQETREEFLKHVTALLSLAGSAPDAAAIQARTVLTFETDLAKSALTNAERRDEDKTYHLMDAAGATLLTPNFPWKLFLREMDLPEGTPINVTQLELLKEFNRQLASASLEDWKTWLRWRVLEVSASYLSKPIREEQFHFSTVVLRGVQQQEPRWQTCVKMVDRDLGDALGEAYVAKYFPPEAKRRMRILAENVRAAMREQLQSADWLDPQTRQNAIHKLEAVTVKIGYPERWRDYSALAFDRAKYFENVRAAWRHNQQYQLAKIGKPADNNDWYMTPPTVNAYSSFQQVEVAFPAGRLQPPYFDMSADDAANYGAIGAVIGHEMGHQFDDQGSKFDANGAQNDWWTPADRKKFDARAACVVDQFNSIDVGEGLRHNGMQVLGEALGDLGGITVAYKAYRRSLDGKPEPPPMDGFRADQRFFIAYARARSADYRPQAMRLQLATNPHPLDKYRVDATLANMPEFQRAFHCASTDPMVRPLSQRCKLW
jgi:putative endopeptidase